MALIRKERMRFAVSVAEYCVRNRTANWTSGSTEHNFRIGVRRRKMDVSELKTISIRSMTI